MLNILRFQFGLLSCTERYGMGLRLSEEDEDLGSDLVEHNIKDPVYVSDGNKMRRRPSFFGKRITFLPRYMFMCLTLVLWKENHFPAQVYIYLLLSL